MTENEPIRKETQLFCWALLLHDLNFSTFVAMPIERQIATAVAYGLSPDGLAIALEQVTSHMVARNSLLKQIAERQAKGAH
jgi:hypothetical protein